MLTLDTLENTTKFYKLLSKVQIDPTCITYLTSYKDELFFDFIAKTDHQFVNFCHINNKNMARYNIILKFHEWIQLNPHPNFKSSVVKVLSLGGTNDLWLYEEMIYYKNLSTISFDECLQIDSTIKNFNNHIKGFFKTLSAQEKKDYNLIMQNYCKDEFKMKFDSNFIFEYGDIFTMFRCNRITKIDNNFQITGYQGFLFYDDQFTKLLIIIMSCMLDTLENKKIKLSLIDTQSTEMLKDIIQILTKKSNNEFKLFLNCDDIFKKHIAELETILWKK